MNNEWSLDVLYQGYQDKKFLDDLSRIDELVNKMNSVASELSKYETKEALHTIISTLEEVYALQERLGGYCSLRQATNTTDSESASYLGTISQKFSNIAKAEAIFKSYIASVDNLETILEGDELLSEYRFMLLEIKKNAKHLLNDQVEEVISKFDISGGSAWEELQSYLTSTVKVDYKGEEITLSSVRNLAYSKDAKERKEAYEAEIAAYDKIKDAVAYSLNSIKLQVLTESELRGYESPLMMALNQSNMQKSTLDAMLTAIKEYLPKFQAYLRRKGEILGSNQGLAWYDMFAPLGTSEQSFSVEEAKDYLLKHFRGFAPDLAEMVEKAFAEEWIDFFPRAGKVGGAFCSNLQSVKQSRVLTNFDGTLSDVVTLAHELGHAYHNQQVHDHRILNTDYSMPVAETASTFNENIIMNAAIDEAEGVEKLVLIESQLQDAAQIICDIYSRYLFETAVFENRKSSFMFADDLKELMLNAQKEAYGDGLDSKTLHPYMWVCKGHYYSSHLSFYNFPYAFGGLFARGLYAKYKAEGSEFVPKYRKLLNATPVSTVEEVAKYADIDLTNPEFWRAGLKSFADQIDEFIKLSKEYSL
ncbi:M3 family oligoendopeptidase [Clostridium sp. Marseille-P299]|uniref:M3 family oligoendopeptidase n=1 Tax=Clostridium sp. Marseille-P299 TaxID=1805477 RepID=UPI000830CF49|nr:M3 family oligoendopeptidase [Clostridium sp. Marseille-P299]